MSFWKTYKTKIIGTLIGIGIPAVFTLLAFAAIAYADDRYIGKAVFQRAQQVAEVRDLTRDVKVLDREIWKMQQEALLTSDDSKKAKYKMYEEFFKREKAAIKDEIKAMTPKDG